MERNSLNKLTLSAMFMALGLILPFITGQLHEIASMLLPMHIPVFLCAFICGWRFGVPVAFVLPLFRSFLFGMPVLFPSAVSMAFELATYAFVSGFLYEKSRWQCVRALLRSMLIAMIAGRIVWGLVQAVLLGLSGSAFTFQAFMAGALINSIPGIILQLVLIPFIMVSLDRTKLVMFKRTRVK